MSWELILKKSTLKVDILNRFETALKTHYGHKLAKNSADKDMFGKVRADGDSKGKQYRKLENTLQGLLGGL